MSCCTDNDRAVLAVRAAGRCSRGQRGDRGSGPRHGGSVLFVATQSQQTGHSSFLFSSFCFLPSSRFSYDCAMKTSRSCGW